MDTLIIFLLAPLLAAALTPLAKRYKLFYHILSIYLGTMNLYLLMTHDYGEYNEIRLGPIGFMMDKYAWFFAVLVNLMWIITLVYSYYYTYKNFQRKIGTFYFFLSLSAALTSAAAFGANILTMAIFYSGSVLVTYYLVGIRNDDHARINRTVFMRNVILPTGLLFLPLALFLCIVTGFAYFSDIPGHSLPFNPWVEALVVAGLIISMSMNAVFPFHRWLPSVWNTPAPVNALLNSVAAVNIGAITLLRLVDYVIGLDTMHELSLDFTKTGWILAVLGANAVFAAWKAWKTTNMKQRFAYSTVSQLSYILTAILIATPTSILAALLHIFTHGLAKSGLIFIAGFFKINFGTVEIPALRPYMPKLKPMALLIATFGLSIIGFPMLAGSYSKDLMIIEEWNNESYFAMMSLIVGSFINILYIYPPVKAAFSKPSDEVKRGFRLHYPLVFLVVVGLCATLVITFSMLLPLVLHGIHFNGDLHVL